MACYFETDCLTINYKYKPFICAKDLFLTETHAYHIMTVKFAVKMVLLNTVSLR